MANDRWDRVNRKPMIMGIPRPPFGQTRGRPRNDKYEAASSSPRGLPLSSDH